RQWPAEPQAEDAEIEDAVISGHHPSAAVNVQPERLRLSRLRRQWQVDDAFFPRLNLRERLAGGVLQAQREWLVIKPRPGFDIEAQRGQALLRQAKSQLGVIADPAPGSVAVGFGNVPAAANADARSGDVRR